MVNKPADTSPHPPFLQSEMFPSLVWELLFFFWPKKKEKRILFLFVDFQKKTGHNALAILSLFFSRKK
jgi:hypothetical protein